MVNLTLGSGNAKRMERQIISPSLFLIHKNGCLLFPVVPHVLDVFVVLEHVEHLLHVLDIVLIGELDVAVLRQHLDLYKEEINRIYKERSTKDLL